MSLLGVPNDVVERIASILLRLREGGEKYGESCCDRRAMEKAFRAVLSLSMTCKELRRLLRPTAMHREARARRDTIIWPSLRVAKRAPRKPVSASHLYSAQRQEEKHSKAQLKMMRSALSAFVCGTPHAALRRAFVKEQAEAGNHYRVRLVDKFADDEILLVSNGFLLRAATEVVTNDVWNRTLHVHKYDDATVFGDACGDDPQSIALLNSVNTPAGTSAFDMVDVYSATGDMIVASVAMESDDDGDMVMNVFCEHHRLNTTKGIVEEVFKACVRSYQAEYAGEWMHWPAAYMLGEDGDPYAVTFSMDRDENGEFSFSGGEVEHLRYNIVKVHDGHTEPMHIGFPLMADPNTLVAPNAEPAARGLPEITDYLVDWIDKATACTLGVVAVSTLGGLRIHSGPGYGTSEHINFQHKLVNEHGMIKTYWTPMQPIGFSENGQFLLAESYTKMSGVPPGIFVLAREGTTGLFSRYPMAALRAEAPDAKISDAVFTACSRYCLFQGRCGTEGWGGWRCWYYVDLHSVFEPVVRYVARYEPHADPQSTLVAVGRPLAPEVGTQCTSKQPVKIRFGSDGVLVHCANMSYVRFTVEGTEQNPKPSVPH